MICTTDRGRNVSSIENMKAESEGPYLNSHYINDTMIVLLLLLTNNRFAVFEGLVNDLNHVG
jgi:hypothetical protein